MEIDVFENVPVEALFGQGIVDAGKAVGGLGAINVRRLSAGDISDAYTVRGKAEKQALYSVDTQGYDSVWSNDIKEIRAGYIAADPLGSGKAADSTEADSDVKVCTIAGCTIKPTGWIKRRKMLKTITVIWLIDISQISTSKLQTPDW